VWVDVLARMHACVSARGASLVRVRAVGVLYAYVLVHGRRKILCISGMTRVLKWLCNLGSLNF
jgi:hypothetical protein